ncbi:hypothetical protein PG991_001762 [Apiospora marii]|uniref:Uncharacterized protein n=1 Tax=Apiospora marii TaxID=335849 RepID=A0ABR1SQL4_9PEZI
MTQQNGSRPFDTTRAMEAYGKYRNFLAAEDRRNQSTDVIVMTNILRLLPNLKAITVRNLQPWGQTPLTSAKVSNLRKAIWISPSFGGSLDDSSTKPLERIQLPHLVHLSLEGVQANGHLLSNTLGQRRLCSLTMKDVTLLDGDWASTIKGFTLHPSIGMLEASEPACIRLAVTPGARILPDSVVTKPGTE